MGKKISDLVALFFVLCVGVLTFLCLLSIWKFIDGDVVFKSMATIGIVAFASIIALFASRAMGNQAATDSEISPYIPLFTSLRYLTSTLLIASVAVLALVGVMAIWDIITDRAVVMKTVVSMVILAFSSFIAIATCAERENRTIFGGIREGRRHISIGGIILLVIICAWLFPVLVSMVIRL